jgi:hypothetical protein
MAAQYGLRARDAAGVVTLDTTVTPIRSLKLLTVTGNGAFDQYVSIPEIKAQSFVVVDALANNGENTWSPRAWWTDGQLQLRQPSSQAWQVMVLSQGGEPFSAPGSYGIRATNNNVRTQIDAVNKVLSVASSGQFQFGQMGPGNYVQWAHVDFPAPVATYERPLVFFNPENYLMAGNFYIKGGPGAWTGFAVKAYANATAHGSIAQSPMTVKWLCASYQAPVGPVGQYGARVRDASGVLTFHTSINLAALNGQPAVNSFYNSSNPITGAGYYATGYQMGWTNSAADYFLANAVLSCTNIFQTAQPIRANFGGFLPNRRDVLQMYCDNSSGIDPVTPNGRTLFAARPVKPI